MREPKLTKSQLRALSILASGPVSYSTWGGKLVTRMPDGISGQPTLWALYRAGYAKDERDGHTTLVWHITPAGRAALAEKDTH
jgi:hypothetical protein